MKTILIGFGLIAPKYVEILNALGCEIVGILARNFDKASINAKKFGIKKIFKSLEEIKDEDFDFTTILVSPENISHVLKEVLPFQKPILVEKPVAFGVSELDKIIELNNKYKSTVMVATNRRFYSIFNKGIEYLNKKNKKLDSIVVEAPERFSDINLPMFTDKVRENWMYANPIHCIDLIRFFGGEVTTLETNSHPEKYQYSAIGHCSDNVEFTYISNWKTPGNWNITLYSDETRLVYNPLEEGTIIEKNEKKVIVPEEEDIKFKPGFYSQVKHFIDNVVINQDFKWPAENLVQHKKTIELIEKIFNIKKV